MFVVLMNVPNIIQLHVNQLQCLAEPRASWHQTCHSATELSNAGGVKVTPLLVSLYTQQHSQEEICKMHRKAEYVAVEKGRNPCDREKVTF